MTSARVANASARTMVRRAMAKPPCPAWLADGERDVGRARRGGGDRVIGADHCACRPRLDPEAVAGGLHVQGVTGEGVVVAPTADGDVHLEAILQDGGVGRVHTSVAGNGVVVALGVDPAVGEVGTADAGSVEIVAADRAAGGAFLDVDALGLHIGADVVVEGAVVVAAIGLAT